jgi:hypothetical protein
LRLIAKIETVPSLRSATERKRAGPVDRNAAGSASNLRGRHDIWRRSLKVDDGNFVIGRRLDRIG